jgi:hypothetical protein
MLKMPPSRFDVKNSRLPSGETAGSSSSQSPYVICSRDSGTPGWKRKIFAVVPWIAE